MIGGRCAGCGLPGHRYGTSDPDHAYNAMGCVNSLRGMIADFWNGLPESTQRAMPTDLVRRIQAAIGTEQSDERDRS